MTEGRIERATPAGKVIRAPNVRFRVGTQKAFSQLYMVWVLSDPALGDDRIYLLTRAEALALGNGLVAASKAELQ